MCEGVTKISYIRDKKCILFPKYVGFLFFVFLTEHSFSVCVLLHVGLIDFVVHHTSSRSTQN